MGYRRTPLMQERLADNRQRIISATRQLVAQGGFREASNNAVSNSVGLSTGAIYRYFPSKADLFVEVLDSAVTHEIEVLRRVVDGPGTARQRLRAAVELFAKRALDGPYLAYAFIAEPTDPEVEAARILCRRRFGAVFEEVLKQGIKSKEFAPQSAEISAACIVGAFTEALIRPVGPAGRQDSNRKLVKSIADFCVRAAVVNEAPG